jgi:hypothetical protein
MTLRDYQNKFQQFRQELYQNFNKRADTALELLDALCSFPAAESPVQLTLSPEFRRTYTALYKAVDETNWKDISPAQLVADAVPRPQQYPFWLLALDVTSQPRPFAQTLADRGFVYAPNSIGGNKPITIGHQYSTVVLRTEKEPRMTKSWVVPLSVRRVATDEDKELIGARQIRELLEDPTLPWHDALTVEVGDTSYSKPAYLHANRDYDNLVTVARVRSNRTFYRQFVYPDGQRPAHRPQCYGEAFKLPDPTTWHPPDETTQLCYTSRRGKHYTVVIQGWHNLLMHGKNKPERIPMAKYPFTLVRVTVYREDGTRAFKRPLWLIAVGSRRGDLSVEDIYAAYAGRVDIEHFFRFGKQKLLLTEFQSPKTESEERWWHIVQLAYTMLWMARHLAHHLPRPWEKYADVAQRREISPTLVQRDFARLIRQLGTPAQPPKPRGKSPGRPPGRKLPPRPRRKVVFKGEKAAVSA